MRQTNITIGTLSARSAQPSVDTLFALVAVGRKPSYRARLLSMAITSVLAFGLSRVSLGPVPLYFTDILIAICLIFSLLKSDFYLQFATSIGIFTLLIFAFVTLSELTGVGIYGRVFESVYMIIRWGLAASLVGLLAATVRNHADLNCLLRGAVAGMIITATLSMLSSLPPTRDLVSSTIFANRILNHDGNYGLEKYASVRDGAAGRGTSLVGTYNFTGGTLGMAWGIAFLASRHLKGGWRATANCACVLTPFGALTTYSRGAWMAVLLVLGVVAVRGYGKGRSKAIVALIVAGSAVGVAGTSSDLFYIDRIVMKTESAIYDRGYGEFERMYSYIEPFEHLIQYPSWSIVGAGAAGRKLAGRGVTDYLVADIGARSDHSTFGMAFFNFGLIAAMCHVFLMLVALIFILKRLHLTRRQPSHERMTWQVGLACWLGILPWWMFDHCIASEPRGAMVYYLMFGFLLAYEKLRVQAEWESRRRANANAYYYARY